MSIETDVFEGGTKLPLMEEFYSLQGEGYNTGRAAYFIRLGGCDIGCQWCDSKRSWNPDLHPLVSIGNIVGRAAATPGKAVVVTGGEPSIYNLEPLTTELKKRSIKTFIETSGAYPLTGYWDWICLSPKRNRHPQEEIYQRANELKLIIFDEDDFVWAEECADRVNKDCRLYLQPEWSRYKQNIHKITNYILQNPRWLISLQAHKYMNIP